MTEKEELLACRDEFEEWFLAKRGFTYDGLPTWKGELEIWQAAWQAGATQFGSEELVGKLASLEKHGVFQSFVLIADVMATIRQHFKGEKL